MRDEETGLETVEFARRVLDTMLGYLGFVVQVEIDESRGSKGLQIFTEEAEALIGRNGARLDDLEYLVNRVVRASHPQAGRVRIDVQHFRSMREDDFVRHIQELADGVRRTGRPVRLRPMNSYYRRLIHNAFKEDPGIESWSPPDQARIKRITLMRRRRRGGGPEPLRSQAGPES